MKILLISLFSHMPHHVATELELLQRHIDEDDDVSVLGCTGFLPACLHKEVPNPARCRECITTRSKALHMLDRMPSIFSMDAFYTAKDRAREESLITSFDSIDAIRDYFIDGFDVGYAALSSTVFMCRDPHLERQEDRELFERMIVAAYRSFCATREFLRIHNDFDRAYVFNGRYATTRGPFRACQQAGVEVHIHERGSNNSRFMIFENAMPHDLEKMKVRMAKAWDDASETEREKEGSKFYIERRDRVERFWHSHTKAQIAGRLPKTWHDDEKNVAIYTSSDDEYVAIAKEWVTPGFKSQTDAIVNLHRALRDRNSKTNLFVRMHPNLKGIDNRDTRTLLALQGEGIEIIPPESDVCSYSMLDKCDRVVTFGSTIGIEATYWRKPSILAGMHFYRALGGAHIATGDEQLLDLVEQEDLPPRPIEAALKFGLYVSNFGQPFKYYKSMNFETGEFRGTEVKTGMSYSLFGYLVPAITRYFGSRPSFYQSIDRFAYLTCYAPFRWFYDLATPLRKRIRQTKSFAG